MHIVREIKKYNNIKVANALDAMGYCWHKNRWPTNIERMVEGLPRCELADLLSKLKERSK